MTTLSRFYTRCLTRYPIVTQAVQTGVLMGAGDCIAQTVVEKKRLGDYDFARTAQFTGLGLFMAGPTLTFWYRFLARRFGDGKNLSGTLKKVGCDQLIFAPAFIGIFLTSLGMVQGDSLSDTTKQLKRNYPDILVMNYRLWPAVQLANFYFVPLQYQVLLVQCVALFWNTYLSWKTQAKKDFDVII